MHKIKKQCSQVVFVQHYSFDIIYFYFDVVDWVKNKLRLLRNSYTKAIKQPASGSARKTPSKRTAWLLDKLQFLSPHVATRPTVSNLGEVSFL
jgi:hypothetical protein